MNYCILLFAKHILFLSEMYVFELEICVHFSSGVLLSILGRKCETNNYVL